MPCKTRTTRAHVRRTHHCSGSIHTSVFIFIITFHIPRAILVLLACLKQVKQAVVLGRGQQAAAGSLSCRQRQSTKLCFSTIIRNTAWETRAGEKNNFAASVVDEKVSESPPAKVQTVPPWGSQIAASFITTHNDGISESSSTGSPVNLKMSHSLRAATESIVDQSEVRNAESLWRRELTAWAQASSSTRAKEVGWRFLW